MAGTKVDVYEMVTQRIEDALEAGTVPWHKPWKSHGVPRNLQSNRPYRGINAFLLAMMGRSTPYWTTYKAAKELGEKQGTGGGVRKGEKGVPVVFTRVIKTGETHYNAKLGRDIEKRVVLRRYYTVFNFDQLENVELPKSRVIEEVDHDSIEAAQEIIDNMEDAPTIKHGGDRAFYRPSEDLVQLPLMGHFDQAESYYTTAFHELVHSTGHGERLNREGWDKASFGNEPYSKEELVAEMGAAMLAGMAGIEDKTIDASASYIAGWLSKLKSDRKLLIQAGSQAQKAADRILGVTFEEAPAEVEEKEAVAV